MRYLIEPKNGIWVATHYNLDNAILRGQILGSDVCISDLDETDARSPGKILAYRDIFSKRIFDPRFLTWSFITAQKLLTHGRVAESDAWEKYVELFLSNPSDRESAMGIFTEDVILKLLYPGVRELYSILPSEMYKIYLSRNIPEAVQPFADFLGFQEISTEVSDKGSVTAQFVEEHPEVRSYFVKGDSEEDEGILDALIFYMDRRTIDYVVSSYVASSLSNTNPKFTINLGRNYLGLVKILS